MRLVIFIWWRSSVVSGWRTIPDLRLIWGWKVTNLWVNCLLWDSYLGQLSLPPLCVRWTSSNPCNGLLGWRVETLILQIGAACGCMVAMFKFCVCGLGLRP